MGISTHVLDTAIGKPAEGVAIRLERNVPSSGWTRLSANVTDANGRVAQLLPANESLRAGAYRLRFDVAAYFAQSARETFFPEVTIEFEIRDEAAHYHVPLLLSPYGYSTYRGS